MAVSFKPEDIPTAFMDAWNRHDTTALASLFAEDEFFLNVVGMWWKSRAEPVEKTKITRCAQ